jgi:release factor H-coupled RctB family protein
VRVIASTKNWIEGAAVQQLEKTAALPGMRLALEFLHFFMRRQR